ncbi:O-antigen ligase family protein [Vibrio sp. PNB23_22_7]
MEVTAEKQENLDLINSRLNLAVFLTPFMHFYLPFVGEVVILAFQISIISILHNMKGEGYQQKFKPLYFFFIAYIISISVSNILLTKTFGWSPEAIISFFRYLIMLSNCFFILSLVSYFNRRSKLPFELLPYSISIAALFIFVDINLNLTGINYNEGLRIIVSSNIRHLGHIVIISSLLVSMKILLGKKLNNPLFFFTSLVSISLLFWLGGRGAILSYSISLLLALFLIFKHHHPDIKCVTRLISLIIISLMVSSPLNIYSWNGLNRLSETQQYKTQDINTLSNNRIKVWHDTFELIKEKPLFGYGAEGFILYSETIFRHPHNFIFQWLLHFGLVGTLLFLLFIVFIFISGYNLATKEKKLENIFPIVALSGLLSNALVSGTLYYSPPVFIFCLLSSLIISKAIPIEHHTKKEL